MKKIFWKATINGFVESIFAIAIVVWVCYAFTTVSSYYVFFWFAIVGAVVSAAVYCFFLRKETQTKTIVLFSAICPIFFVFGCVLLTVLYSLIPITLSVPENNAVGLLALFVVGCYLIILSVLKVCVFIALIIKNICKKRREKG